MVDGYILSYINPDTDGVCTSLAIAELYMRKEKGRYLPIFKGKLSEETKYVLEKAEVGYQFSETVLDNKKPIILVDTHQLVQLPHLHDPSMVVEIWDHHPDGDEKKFVNAEIHNYKIGAIASKILDEMLKNHCLSRKFAILLGSAIISNTINFTAPSTTKYDKEMFLQAMKVFEFDTKYIEGMFECRDAILNQSINSMLLSDIKYFCINGKKCMVSQIEVSSVDRILEYEDINLEMQKLKDIENAYVFLFNIIDMRKKKSVLICGDKHSEKMAEKMFAQPFRKGVLKFDKILLRKTELIPLLTRIIADVNE